MKGKSEEKTVSNEEDKIELETEEQTEEEDVMDTETIVQKETKKAKKEN